MMINKCLLSPNHLGPLGLLSGAALFVLLLFPASSSSFGHGPMFLPGGGHQMPSFLRDVNGQARRQFFQIVRSPNDTKAQVQAQLTAWAQQNGVQAAMQNFTQSQQQRAEQIRANLTNLLAGPAVQLLNDYWTVRQNMGISRVSECQQIRQLMEAAQPLLRRLVPIPPSVIPGPPPRACFFRGPFSPGGPGDSDGDLPSSRRMRRAVPNPPTNSTEGDSGLEGEDAEDT